MKTINTSVFFALVFFASYLSAQTRIITSETNTSSIQTYDLNGENRSYIFRDFLNKPSFLYVDDIENKLYWGNQESICRSNLDGTQKEIVIRTRLPKSLAIDHVNNKMYYGAGDSSDIYVSDLDGSNQEKVFSTTEGYGVKGIDISHELNKIFFTAGRMLFSSDFNFNNPESLWTQGISLGKVRIDTNAERIFYIAQEDILNGKLYSRKFDGSDMQTLNTPSTEKPLDFDINKAEQKIYWTDQNLNSIKKANLDGSDITEVLTFNFINPFALSYSIAVSQNDGGIFWTSPLAQQISGFQITTGPTEIIIGLDVNETNDVLTDKRENLLYFLDEQKLFKSELNGENVESLIADNFLIKSFSKNDTYFFFADEETEEIHRSDLEGNNIISINNKGQSISDILIDECNQKLIWLDNFQRLIRQSNYDGTGVEDLYEVPSDIYSLALDCINNKLYWSGRIPVSFTEEIYSFEIGTFALANTIIANRSNLRAINIDQENNKLYWTETESNSSDQSRLHRSNLDGSEEEVLFDAHGMISGIDFIYDESIDAVQDIKTLNISVFPNPSASIVNIKADTKLHYRYQLFNSVGKTIKQGGNTASIDLKDLQPGTYFLEIIDLKTGLKTTKKIIRSN